MTPYLLLIGLPGSGKGTQAKLMTERFRLTHVSSGDLFRENIKAGTALGKQVEAFLKAGKLVPDQLTIDMIRERLSQPDCKSGAVLDGFPRTVAQAVALSQMLQSIGGELVKVLFIKVGRDILLERLLGRWTCPKCSAIYHTTFSPPQEEGVCDQCQTKLVQRADDQESAILARVSEYEKWTAAVLAHYEKLGLLVVVNGVQSIEKVWQEIETALSQVIPTPQSA
ncbi:MAG: adenylate kinase [Patescibacteria group bacterium]